MQFLFPAILPESALDKLRLIANWLSEVACSKGVNYFTKNN